MESWETVTEYVRYFSRLEGLQAAYSLRYRMEPSADGWKLDLTRSDGMQEQIRLRCSRRQAQKLLCMLYENAVQPEHGAALAEDFLPVE